MSRPLPHCENHSEWTPICQACKMARDGANSLPNVPKVARPRDLDFNDVRRQYGDDAVAKAIAGARAPGEIIPLRSPAETERRERQRRLDREISEGASTVPLARIYSLEEMLEQFVFIKDGSQVAPIDRPQCVLALSDFRNALAGSKVWIESDGRQKAKPAVTAWLEHPDRREAETLTFHAGGPTISQPPSDARQALNIWRPIDRGAAPSNWQSRAAPFVEHVKWLWGEDAEPFLDWLAHIQQQPGILPHYGWVHISREHGKGRNWISSVLTRVFAPYVCPGINIVSILDNGFNGELSRRLLAIVDEINEGGSSVYRHAQSLRQLVTAEYRDINPKYGRTRREHNSCRWLLFSNHTGALPLTEEDRRFWIVSHSGAPKAPGYYEALYKSLEDPQFIKSVSEYLARRNISQFKPGQRPPMNDAKAALVAFSQSDDDVILKEIAARWPVDLITAFELRQQLRSEDALSRLSVRHAMDRAGICKVDRKARISGQGAQGVYAVRNFAAWKRAEPHEIQQEIFRVASRSLPDPDDGA